jgi:L-asparagine oxygenase
MVTTTVKENSMVHVGEPQSPESDGLICSAAPESSVLAVDPATALDIAEAARTLAAEHRGGDGSESLDNEELMLRCELALRLASPSLLASLLAFRRSSSEAGILLLRGLPVDAPLPATPTTGAYDGPWGRLAVSTIGQLMVMSALGDVIAYEDEKAGRLVQDICPVPGAEQRQENTGSCLLELHTEDGFHPAKPHFLSLFCLRSDHEHRALTVAGGVRAVLPLLDVRVLQLLREPLYRIKLASSFVGAERDVFVDPMPVLSGSWSDPELCVDFHAMEPMSVAAAWALEKLREQMVGSLVGAVLEPGDLLVVDNRKAVHGRTGFSPRYDGQDRWLRRCFAVTDIRAAQPQLRPASRVHRALQVAA